MKAKLNRLFDLTGRVAIVTGGSRGLGLQIATALGEYGATVALVARKQSELDGAVEALASEGIVARGFRCDLSEPGAGVALAVEVLGTLGRIDILVNNAGATWGAKAEDYPIAGWSKVIDLNVTGLFLLSQAVANAAFLPQERGVILNIASVLGLVASSPDQVSAVAYNAAKGAVLSMTRQLAAEWGPRGIRVNALAPGFFPSRMTAGTLAQTAPAMIAATPLGKLGNDTDLMGAALLLVSDAGGQITGQTLVIDGGMSIV